MAPTWRYNPYKLLILFTSKKKAGAHARLSASFARWLKELKGLAPREKAREALLEIAEKEGAAIRRDDIKALNDLVRAGVIVGAEKSSDGSLRLLDPLLSGGSEFVALTSAGRSIVSSQSIDEIKAIILRSYTSNPLVASLLYSIRDAGITEVELDERGLTLIADITRRAIEDVARLLHEWRHDIPHPLKYAAQELAKPQAARGIVKGVFMPLDILSNSRLVELVASGGRRRILFKLESTREELAPILGVKEIVEAYCAEDIVNEGIPLYYLAKKLGLTSEALLWSVLMASGIEPRVKLVKITTYGTVDMEYAVKVDPEICGRVKS